MDDPILISALNKYSYCPRRCYLIHVEAEFEDAGGAEGDRELRSARALSE